MPQLATRFQLEGETAHQPFSRWILVGAERGLQAFVDDGLQEHLPLGLGPGGEQPVIGNGKGVGHFRGVQEVPGMPVGESRGGLQLLPEALQVAAAALDPVHQGQGVNPVQNPAAGSQHAVFPRGLAAAGSLGEEAPGFFPDGGVQLSRGRVVLDEALEALKLALLHQQPGMRLFHLLDQGRQHIGGAQRWRGGPPAKVRVGQAAKRQKHGRRAPQQGGESGAGSHGRGNMTCGSYGRCRYRALKIWARKAKLPQR